MAVPIHVGAPCKLIKTGWCATRRTSPTLDEMAAREKVSAKEYEAAMKNWAGDMRDADEAVKRIPEDVRFSEEPVFDEGKKAKKA